MGKFLFATKACAFRLGRRVRQAGERETAGSPAASGSSPFKAPRHWNRSGLVPKANEKELCNSKLLQRMFLGLGSNEHSYTGHIDKITLTWFADSIEWTCCTHQILLPSKSIYKKQEHESNKQNSPSKHNNQPLTQSASNKASCPPQSSLPTLSL